jgi:DNA-binding transcriptional regulator YiaG
MLDVTFVNGDRFLVPVESILTSTPVASVQWSKLRIAETGDVLEAPADGAVAEIPWDRIRSVADPDFRAHLADQASERARSLGGRIRSWRLGTKLTRRELAARVGVRPEVVAGWERGKTAPPSELIEDVALALGKRLRDFASE